MLGPLLASFLGGQDKADVASLAKQAGNVGDNPFLYYDTLLYVQSIDFIYSLFFSFSLTAHPVDFQFDGRVEGELLSALEPRPFAGYQRSFL